MRILHTSDWHIGRTFHGNPTLGFLAEVLDALVAQVREHEVDLVLVSGDVFDSATPAAACFTLLTDTLAALRDTGAQVVVTSGNHDSAARLGFQARLLRDGIHVVTDPLSVGTPITIDDEHGPVHVYGIPYLEPALVRHLWPGVELRTQADTLAHAMGLVRDDLAQRGGRSLAMAHCFTAGGAVETALNGTGATPGVERDIQQGGLDVAPLSTFDGPDYVALGHIHGRNALSERVRYSGAPLHYGFGENPHRGSWLVDLDADGLAGVEWLPLPVPRRLATIRGTLDELLADPALEPHRDDWVCAVLTDPTPQLEPMRRLQTRFPWCATIQLAPAGAPGGDGRTYVERVREAVTDLDVVDRFLAHVRAGEGASERERMLVDDVVAGARAEELTT